MENFFHNETTITAKYGKGTSADGKCEDYMGYNMERRLLARLLK
jgi:hypothetical protein